MHLHSQDANQNAPQFQIIGSSRGYVYAHHWWKMKKVSFDPAIANATSSVLGSHGAMLDIPY